MSLGRYLRDRAVACVLLVICAFGVAGMFMVLGDGVQAAVLGACFVVACGAVVFAYDFARRRRFYDELVRFTDDLENAYYASSLLEEPEFLEGCLTFEALEATGKAAADDVAAHKQQAEAYRDYIELWIHEIKTPIAAAGLMAANLHGPEATKLKGELDRIEGYVEQALYYARSTSLARDFAIREVPLESVVRGAVKKHARFLIEQGTTPVIELGRDVRVFADAKWLAFIVGQLVTNAAKYGATQVRFSTRTEGEGTPAARTVLEVADDGPGIPAADVPRVFERGFTGQNGRMLGSSTGMGLYLVSELCAKMDLGVGLASEEGSGTRVLISFPHDRRRLDTTLFLSKA